MQRKQILSLVMIAIATAGATRAFADDSCIGFKWDVRKERALFGGAPAARSAGKDLPSAPTILAGRLYALQLAPQTAVSFAAAVEDYQGLHSCDAPHKVVEFNLAGTARFVLQLSGAPKAAIRLTVTQAPPRT